MLARSLRLRRPRDISAVYQRGRYAATEALQVKALANGLAHNRAAVVVSRKVSKKATARNLSRRRVSGALEALWKGLPEGYDLVITLRRELDKEPAEALKTSLEKLIGRSIEPKERK